MITQRYRRQNRIPVSNVPGSHRQPDKQKPCPEMIISFPSDQADQYTDTVYNYPASCRPEGSCHLSAESFNPQYCLQQLQPCAKSIVYPFILFRVIIYFSWTQHFFLLLSFSFHNNAAPDEMPSAWNTLSYTAPLSASSPGLTRVTLLLLPAQQ